MGLITDAEEAVATGGTSIYVKLALTLLPFAVALGLLVALIITRGTLHSARQDAKLLASQSATALAEAKAKWASDGKTAAETYATAIATRQPIIVRSTDEVTHYAQTPAGAAHCADAGRVSSTDLLDRQLWPAQPAKSGAGTMPANPAKPAG